MSDRAQVCRPDYTGITIGVTAAVGLVAVEVMKELGMANDPVAWIGLFAATAPIVAVVVYLRHRQINSRERNP